MHSSHLARAAPARRAVHAADSALGDRGVAIDHAGIARIAHFAIALGVLTMAVPSGYLAYGFVKDQLFTTAGKQAVRHLAAQPGAIVLTHEVAPRSRLITVTLGGAPLAAAVEPAVLAELRGAIREHPSPSKRGNFAYLLLSNPGSQRPRGRTVDRHGQPAARGAASPARGSGLSASSMDAPRKIRDEAVPSVRRDDCPGHLRSGVGGGVCGADGGAHAGVAVDDRGRYRPGHG